MKRFVVIATALRGKVDPPEPVGAEMDAAIFQKMYQEVVTGQDRVVWRDGWERKLPARAYVTRAREDRMMELAKKARVA